MCAQSSSRDTFDRLASEYDELKLRVVPGYREVQDLALRYASARPSQRVLELGCGTGEWASAFFRNHPEADYVAVEFSPKMRDLAATRLAAHRTRLQLLDQDLSAPLPEGPFDLVVSFFAIITLKTNSASSMMSSRLLCRVACSSTRTSRLRQIQGSSDRSWTGGSHSMRGAGLDPERIPHVLADHREHDIAESSSTQLSYLRAAGFAPAEVIWAWEKFAVFYATKPIPTA
jgi:tRNA (cmo5U34)-methyltransferase